MFFRLTVAMCAVPLALSSVAAASPSGYYITDIGVLPGDTGSAAYGVNDSGQVVGASISSAGTSSVVLYSGGSLIDISALASLSGSGAATGINDSGTVALSVGSGPRKYGYLYAGGTATELSAGTGVLNGLQNRAYAINSTGEVTGYYSPISATTAAFLYSATSGASSDIENTETNSTNYHVYLVSSNGSSGPPVKLPGSSGMDFDPVWRPIGSP